MRKKNKQQNKIAELTANLQGAQRESDYYKGRFENVRDELTDAQSEAKRARNELAHLQGQERESLYSLNEKLLEIVRWLANPETAKDPWNSMARSKDGNGYRHQHGPY